MTFGAWAELIASGLITGGVYALVALGLNLQYGLMRILNIAHGEFLMLGAFLTWFAQTSLGLSPLLMLPVSFALLMALGLVIHRLTFRLTDSKPAAGAAVLFALGSAAFTINSISFLSISGISSSVGGTTSIVGASSTCAPSAANCSESLRVKESNAVACGPSCETSTTVEGPIIVIASCNSPL